MLHVFPDYYEKFQCIASRCKHNCCIGWEIDIDEDTMTYYRSVTGEMGYRLRQNISQGETPHFILGERERCPFLNQNDLCDIILKLGEEHICGICTDHPRFRNELPGRLETGLGMCCEEAGRLILGQQAPVKLVLSGEPEVDDEIIALRDQVIFVLQDRNNIIPERIEDMLDLCGGMLPEKTMAEWAKLLLSLERLDETWTYLLESLRDNYAAADFAGFDAHMAGRQTEYEQLLLYLVYRHMANASNDWDLAARAGFAAFAYQVIYTLGAILWTNSGSFSFEDQVELARLFSSEIEYSDENLYTLFDELC